MKVVFIKKRGGDKVNQKTLYIYKYSIAKIND